MKIKLYKSLFIDELSSIYDPEEIESFFYLILESKNKLKRIDLALNPDLIFNDENINYWTSITENLKQEIPIQYLLGKTSFYGFEFEVNHNVLIPRPETEELVDWIIKSQTHSKTEANENKKIKILDLCTGSGCIAIVLARTIPNAEVYALDISEKALEVARKNATINQVSVNFICCDLLKVDDLKHLFDIIVSNPPYVRELEKQEIKKNVLSYEPHLALFVEDSNALVFYKKIAELSKINLKPNGKLFFEINQYLGKEMVDLLISSQFKNIELRKDIYGNDRMIKANL